MNEQKPVETKAVEDRAKTKKAANDLLTEEELSTASGGGDIVITKSTDASSSK